MTSDDTLRGHLERLRSALPSASSSVTLTRADLDQLLGAPDEVDPIGDLTVSEIAEELGKAPSTIRTWLGTEGGIPGSYRLHGREWRVPRSALREYLRRGSREADPHLDGGGDLGAWRRMG